MSVGSEAPPEEQVGAGTDAQSEVHESEHWQSRLDTFVGREREMQVLREQIDEAVEGRGGLVLVSGEPGIGKTRLLTEAARYADTKNTKVLWGRCWEGEGAPALWPWQQILRTCAADNHRYCELGALIHSAQADPSDTAQAPCNKPRPISDEAQFQLFDMITEALKEASRHHPLVLLVDDLHQADHSSIRALEFLLTEIKNQRCAIVATVRSLCTSAHPNLYLRRLESDPHTTHLRLLGLNNTAVRSFIALHLPDVQISKADIHRIGQRTEGNPFFLHEVCQAFREAQTTDVPAVLDVPESAQALLDKRLAHLPDECTALLHIASVVGRTFTVDLVDKVITGPTSTQAALCLAEERGLVVPSGRQADEYQFSHALIREAFYGRLSNEARRRIHARVAEQIEEDCQSGEVAVDSLAHHYYQAREMGTPGKALRYTMLAAEHAMARATYDHAVALFIQALSQTTNSNNDHLEILLKLGSAQSCAGTWEASRETFLRAARIARSRDLPSKFAEAAIGAKGLILSPAPPDQRSIELLLDALSRLHFCDTTVRVRLLHAVATATHFSPPHSNRADLANEALRLAEADGGISDKATALEAVIVANWRPGRATNVITYAKRLLELGTEMHSSELRAKAHIHLYLAKAQNRETAAHSELDLAEKEALLANHPKLRWQVSLLRSTQALARGSLDNGLAHAQAAHELGKKCHDETAFLHLALNLLLRARLRGTLDDAEDSIRAGARLTPDIPLTKIATDIADFAIDSTALRPRVLNDTLSACSEYLHIVSVRRNTPFLKTR